jgi:hypothetical protein
MKSIVLIIITSIISLNAWSQESNSIPKIAKTGKYGFEWIFRSKLTPFPKEG